MLTIHLQNTIKETKMIKYKNGNTEVTILSDGTKIREYSEEPNIVHPESIDVKITDYCDMGCLYCHESSTTKGKHGDLKELLSVLSDLPSGVELAIGGGNPLSHPNLIPFLTELKQRGLIANITINQGHLRVHLDLIKYLIKDELIKGVGISITSNNFKVISELKELTDNIVYHVIAGVNKVDVLDKLMDLGSCKVLILGYKSFGFGVGYYSEEVLNNLKTWCRSLNKYIGKCTLSFDNLAIDQLKVRRLFTQRGWDKFYMGDDFCFTMYIDAVKKEYAPTSRSKERKSFDKMGLIEYFETRNK